MRHVDELWVAAVSGGIDSVVMLDHLVRHGFTPVVAHVDHGLRADSRADADLVRKLAADYGLPYEEVRLDLPARSSEDAARQARHQWLESVRRKHRADVIATAHHADDVIETVLINLVRGTGWRGVSSLRETKRYRRPLLEWSKTDIVQYALEHGLSWHEDCTNEDLRFLRNYLRHGIVPRFSSEERRAVLTLARRQVALREEIETEAHRLAESYVTHGRLKRYPIIMSPDGAAEELLRQWLGENHPRGHLRRILRFAKSARPGARLSLDGRRYVQASARELVVSPREDC